METMNWFFMGDANEMGERIVFERVLMYFAVKVLTHDRKYFDYF